MNQVQLSLTDLPRPQSQGRCFAPAHRDQVTKVTRRPVLPPTQFAEKGVFAKKSNLRSLTSPAKGGALLKSDVGAFTRGLRLN
jgi:hypothetical protein